MIRGFILRHDGAFYGLLALFIATEGVVLLNYRQYWWIPLLMVPVLIIIMMAWRHYKVIVKVIMTMVIMFIIASFMMVFSSSYSSSTIKGLTVPLSMITGTSIFLLISYYIDTNVSRWTSAQMSICASLITTYMMMPLGLMGMSITAGLTVIIIGVILMFTMNAWNRRAKGMPVRLRSLRDSDTIRIKKALGSDWMIREEKSYRYPFYVLMRKGDDRMLALIPLDFDYSIKESNRRGLLYKRRRIGEYLYKVISYVRRRTDNNIIPIIIDHEGRSDAKDIIGIRIKDSNEACVYTKIIDISKPFSFITSDINNAIQDFDYPSASPRSIRKFKAIMNDGKEPDNA